MRKREKERRKFSTARQLSRLTTYFDHSRLCYKNDYLSRPIFRFFTPVSTLSTPVISHRACLRGATANLSETPCGRIRRALLPILLDRSIGPMIFAAPHELSISICRQFALRWRAVAVKLYGAVKNEPGEREPAIYSEPWQARVP